MFAVRNLKILEMIQMSKLQSKVINKVNKNKMRN